MVLVFHYCFVELGAVTDPDRGVSVSVRLSLFPA